MDDDDADDDEYGDDIDGDKVDILCFTKQLRMVNPSLTL